MTADNNIDAFEWGCASKLSTHRMEFGTSLRKS
jgi:hypothetical protein